MPPLPAISCLGAFPTPASERVAGLVIAGVRKPAHEEPFKSDARMLQYRAVQPRSPLERVSAALKRWEDSRWARRRCTDAASCSGGTFYPPLCDTPPLPKRIKVHRYQAGNVARLPIEVRPALLAAVEWVKVSRDSAGASRENQKGRGRWREL